MVARVRVVEEDSFVVGALEKDECPNDVSLALDWVDSGETSVLELEKVRSCNPEAVVVVLSIWVDCISEVVAVVEAEEDFDDVDSVSGEENVEIFVTNMLVKSSVDDEEGDKSDAGTATL